VNTPFLQRKAEGFVNEYHHSHFLHQTCNVRNNTVLLTEKTDPLLQKKNIVGGENKYKNCDCFKPDFCRLKHLLLFFSLFFGTNKKRDMKSFKSFILPQIRKYIIAKIVYLKIKFQKKQFAQPSLHQNS
jgi:hypothetical protein